MTSEIRTNSLKSRAGLSTVTLTDSGPMFSGITTFVDNSTFSVGTGGTIHAPAANTLNIGVNNTESLRIDSNSNLKVAGIVTATTFVGAFTGAASQVTATANNDNTAYRVPFTSAATGSASIYTDTNNGMTYNPSSGTLSATTFSGDGSNLTGITGTTINNNANNRIITGSGSANTLEGESSFTYNGNGGLDMEGTGAAFFQIKTPNNTDGGIYFRTGSTNAGAVSYLHTTNTTDKMSFRIGSTNKFIIHTSGFAELSGAADVRLTLGNAGTAGTNNANWIRGVNNNLYYNAATSDHLWEIGGAEHMRLDNSGNLFLRSESANYVVLGSSGDGTSGGITNNMNWIRGNGNNTQYNTSGGFHSWEVSGSEKVRIDSSGRLLIGATTTSSPAKLAINGGVNNAEAFLELNRTNDPASGQNIGIIEFCQGNSASRLAARIITRRDGGVWGAASLPSRFEFHTCSSGTNSAQERLRIDSAGNIFTSQNGTNFSWPSNPGHIIYPDGEYRSTSANGTHIRCNRMNGNGHVAQWYRGQTNMVGFISITSSGTSYGSGSSDERTKKNIEVWNENVLDKFKSLTPKKFNFNWEDDTAEKHKGYIAQNEVDKFPEAYPKNNLTDCDNEFYTFTPTDMTVYLMKGLKEAAEKIQKLEEDNIALRVRVTNLEGE